MVCKACKERVKDWEGSDPKCGFLEREFSPQNWRCATVSALRQLLSKAESTNIEGIDLRYGHSQSVNDEQRYATINVTDIKALDDNEVLSLWVTWYKNRGSTEAMWLLYTDGIPPKPPTEDEVLAIVNYYKQSKGVTDV